MTEHPGPFASIYIETVSDTEDAAHQQRLRSRAVRKALDGDGADSAVLDAVERGLSDPPPGHAGQAVIADADGVLLTEALPEPPARTTVRLSSMPYLLPLLQSRSPALAHVVAVVDDRGADLYTEGRIRPRCRRRICPRAPASYAAPTRRCRWPRSPRGPTS